MDNKTLRDLDIKQMVKDYFRVKVFTRKYYSHNKLQNKFMATIDDFSKTRYKGRKNY